MGSNCVAFKFSTIANILLRARTQIPRIPSHYKTAATVRGRPGFPRSRGKCPKDKGGAPNLHTYAAHPERTNTKDVNLSRKEASMQTVGFIGLGNLGTPMAQNIQRAGFPMAVYDLREGATRALLEGGARLAASPGEVAAVSDVIISCVPGPTEVEEITLGPDGILGGLNPGDVYVDLSTSRPSLIRRIGRLFMEKGVHVLDAPVLASPETAADRQVIVMPSGDKDVYEQLLPVFEAFADKVVYQGDLGMGTTCKLVNNMITLAVRQVVAEGLTLGMKAGLDLDALMEAGSRGILGSQREGLERTVFPRKVRAAIISAGTGAKRHRTGKRASPGTKRSDAGRQHCGAAWNPVRQPRLGKHGHARNISPARGSSRRGDQVVMVRNLQPPQPSVE